MCFSASASFTAAAFLIPTGIYCTYSAIELKRFRYLAIALVPFFFGVQQFIEGLVWLSMAHHNQQAVRLSSIGFLFFSHFFWPFWIPISAYFIAPDKKAPRAWIKLGFAVLGTVLGILFFAPILMDSSIVQTHMHANSIQYNDGIIAKAILGTSLGKYLYIAVIIIPLWLSRDWVLKLFGTLIFISVIVTYAFYNYAFNSVWCFFSAVISLYIVFLVRRTKAHGYNVVVKKTDDKPYD